MRPRKADLSENWLSTERLHGALVPRRSSARASRCASAARGRLLRVTSPLVSRAKSPEAVTPASVAAATGPPAASPLAGPPPIGSRIGRFTVLGHLGRGGMGVVVSAYDPELDRRVALKLVSTPFARLGRALGEQLLREARAMAKLRHPNVVAIYEVGEHDHSPYLAMEQVDGGTLRDHLDSLGSRKARDWRSVLSLFLDAGRGLAAAHAAGIIHRDFKPANVFVDESGRALVGDFGLAAAIRLGEDRAAAPSATTSSTGAGTPSYMAPEQHIGDEVDERADQFAFCVALYEALYGELPFPGDSRVAYVEAVRAGAVKPATAARNVPSWLREVLVRGMAASPDDRHASMEELLSRLAPDAGRAWWQGKRERTALVCAVGGFITLWAAAIIGLDIELTYPVHYATNLTLLALFLAVAWRVRDALVESEFNRRLMGLGAAGCTSVVVLVLGGQLHGLDPHTVGVLHLLVIGSVLLCGPFIVDRRLFIPPAAYFACFLIAASWPSTLFAALMLCHSILAAVILYVAIRPPSATRRAGRDEDHSHR